MNTSKTLRAMGLGLMALALMGPHGAAAQSPAPVEPNYALAARFSPRQLSALVKSRDAEPHWIQGTHAFWYYWSTPDLTSWYLVDAATGSKRPFFDNADFAAKITEAVKDPYDAQHLPLNVNDLKFINSHTFTFTVTSTAYEEPKPQPKDTVRRDSTHRDSTHRKPMSRPAPTPRKEHKVHYFEFDINTQVLKERDDYKKPWNKPRFGSISPAQDRVVYVKNHNLYWMSLEDYTKARINAKDTSLTEHPITTCGEEGFSYGYYPVDYFNDTSYVDRRMSPSLYWSPDGKHFALIRTDERKVKDLWVIDALAEPRPKLRPYKYVMPGEKDYRQKQLEIFTFDGDSCRGKVIRTAAFKDQSLGIFRQKITSEQMADTLFAPRWLGDNDRLYVYRQSRDLKRYDLCAASPLCDSLTPLVEERLNTYVESQDPLLVQNGQNLVEWSERTGWAQLYRYSKDGKLLNAITTGPWHVDKILGSDDLWVYFMACGREAGEDPYYQHLYRAKLDGSQTQLLTPGNFHHSCTASQDCARFVVTRSRANSAPECFLIDKTGKQLETLGQTDIRQLQGMGYRFPEPFCVKAADGRTNLYGVMYKPYDFDSTRTYPVIEYVYPGPQVEAVDQAWSLNMTRTARLAQLGFIVVTVGNRGGHPDRSKWYHNYGYGNLRDYGLADQKAALEQLGARHSYIDLTRVGITGHSGGGFMSTAAILTYPHFYKVAVSCAGNHENNIYNNWWSEQHQGLLENISAAGDTTFSYTIKKNTELAHRLQGHLLLVHGDVDNNVHPANTTRMVNALIRYNKRFDMLYLPGQAHSFGDMNEYFFWRMGDYFCRHLLGSQEESIDIPQLAN